MISREYFNSVTLDIIEALYDNPVEEIEEIRQDWLTQLNLCPKAIEFYNAVTDAVVEYKMQEERAAI